MTALAQRLAHPNSAISTPRPAIPEARALLTRSPCFCTQKCGSSYIPVLRVEVAPYNITLIALDPASVEKADINLSGIINGSDDDDDFFSVTKAPGELSILAEKSTAEVILNAVTEKQLELLEKPSRWKAFKIVGPLDLSMVGVLHEFTAPLKQARIPIFVSSTFLTDYILVGEDKLERAVDALKSTGWRFA